QRGLTSGDLASLIASSISLVGVQISSWDNLPQSEINAIFDNFITNTTLSKEIAANYGLNWANVQEILNSLNATQKSQLQSILVSLGSWPATTVVSTATNAAGNKIIITLNKVMANPDGKHGEFSVLVGGTPNPVTAAALDSLSTKKIVLTLTAVASGSTVTLSYTAGTVKSADGVALPSFSGRAVTVLVPISTPAVTVTPTSKDLAVTAAMDDVTITVPSDVTDATINVAELLLAPAGDTVTTAPMPAELKIEASTTISDVKPVEISIPAGTTISAADSDNWDGTINVPTVKANNTVTVTADAGKTATVEAVIEIGFNDVPLTFSKAVRILIPGQAGKDAGYYRGTTFTKITTVLNADTQAAGDALAPGQDGKIDVGTDLVIWTKHFTKFIAYTQTSSGGGGGGGGGGVTFTGTIDSTGGTVSKFNATIIFPAGAVTRMIGVKVEKVSDTSGLPVPVNSKLVSDVVNITKDKSGDFLKPVTITMTFDKTLADSEKYDIGIYWLDGSANKWIKLDNIKVDQAAGTVSGDISHFTKFAVIAEEKAPVPAFKDIAGHWASASINRLVQSGAIKGYADGTFKPGNNITRAEFATVLVKAFKLEPKTGRVFTDTAAHWAKDNIATASAYGIVNGYNDLTFGPDQLITREQMAVMVVKAAGLATPLSNGTSFADSKSISVWAAGPVAVAVMNNVIKGYPDNTFRPQGNATRAEAVTVIANAMK
ncbi:MAG: S-layer homology domain-containing protein, partial [Desulfocucumaceae bacterium]